MCMFIQKFSIDISLTHSSMLNVHCYRRRCRSMPKSIHFFNRSFFSSIVPAPWCPTLFLETWMVPCNYFYNFFYSISFYVHLLACHCLHLPSLKSAWPLVAHTHTHTLTHIQQTQTAVTHRVVRFFSIPSHKLACVCVSTCTAKIILIIYLVFFALNSSWMKNFHFYS